MKMTDEQIMRKALEILSAKDMDVEVYSNKRGVSVIKWELDDNGNLKELEDGSYVCKTYSGIEDSLVALEVL